jgi:hypothetical protein
MEVHVVAVAIKKKTGIIISTTLKSPISFLYRSPWKLASINSLAS